MKNPASLDKMTKKIFVDMDSNKDGKIQDT